MGELIERFDPVDFLDSPEAACGYLTEALETADAAFIADALGVVARARGMTEVARITGLSRESLYKALSAAGNPELATILKVMTALGMKLSAEKSNAAPPSVHRP